MSEDPATNETGPDPSAPSASADDRTAEEREADAFAEIVDANPELAVEADAAAAAVEVDLDLAKVATERDEYLDALRRLQADFENFKKRTTKQQSEALDRGREHLAQALLPVLDAADLALAHGGADGVEQIAGMLFDALVKEGLEGIAPESGSPFDPTVHDAVMHEDGEGGPVIVEVLRAGYAWRGKLLRPAMVKVQG